MRFYWERVEASRNFANKIWNASRFIMMNLEGAEVPADVDPADLDLPSRWILHLANELAEEMTENMEKYELGIAVQKVYDFILDEFCDWYIEFSKPTLQGNDEKAKGAILWTLRTVLSQALKLLHPFMPFITEEIYCTLNPDEETVMLADWPAKRDDRAFAKEAEQVELAKEAVRAIRNIRMEMDVPPSKKANIYIVSESEEVLESFRGMGAAFTNLARAERQFAQKDKSGIDESAVSAVIPGATLYIPLEELVDTEAETARLQKEKERLTAEIARSEGMLNNPNFTGRAPAEKVEAEREKLAKYEQMMAQVTERLEQLLAK